MLLPKLRRRRPRSPLEGHLEIVYAAFMLSRVSDDAQGIKAYIV